MDIHERMEKLTKILEWVKDSLPKNINFHYSLYARDITNKDEEYWESYWCTKMQIEDLKNIAYINGINLASFEEDPND